MNWSLINWKNAFRVKKEKNTFRLTLANRGNNVCLEVNGKLVRDSFFLSSNETYWFSYTNSIPKTRQYDYLFFCFDHDGKLIGLPYERCLISGKEIVSIRTDSWPVTKFCLYCLAGLWVVFEIK